MAEYLAEFNIVGTGILRVNVKEKDKDTLVSCWRSRRVARVTHDDDSTTEIDMAYVFATRYSADTDSGAPAKSVEII